jgi:hypothetical protein
MQFHLLYKCLIHLERGSNQRVSHLFVFACGVAVAAAVLEFHHRLAV